MTYIRKEEKAVKKRKIAALLSVMVMTAMFGGCGSNQSTDTISDDVEKVEEGEQAEEGQSQSGTVALKVWAEETQFDTVQKMIDSFKQNYAGQATFDITMEAMSDANTRNYLLGDVHNAADVFSFPDDQLNSMVAGGALDEVKNESVKSANLEAAVSAASLNGKLYAYPMTADNGYFLYYDKNYFSPEDVTTLDSILAICEENGKKFSMELDSGWYLYSFFGNTGLEMGLNEDGITNYCNWNAIDTSITGVDVAEALLNMKSSSAFLNQPDGDFVLSAQEGTAIAGISGTWNAMAIKQAWGDNYGACKLPTYTCKGQQIQMSSFKGYKMIGVNYYSNNKEWAHKLADWMTNETNQTLRFEEQNTGPSNINAAASDAVNQVPAISAVIEQAEYGVLQRVGNTYWDACTSFVNAILDENLNEEYLQELMDKLAKGIASS